MSMALYLWIELQDETINLGLNSFFFFFPILSSLFFLKFD